jgi:hypothetical protein
VCAYTYIHTYKYINPEKPECKKDYERCDEREEWENKE